MGESSERLTKNSLNPKLAINSKHLTCILSREGTKNKQTKPKPHLTCSSTQKLIDKS